MLLEVENAGYATGQPVQGMILDVSSPVLEIANMDPELFEAVTLGKVDLLDALLEQNVDILQQFTPMKDTAIHIAAGLGHLEIVERVHHRCPTLFTKANRVGDTPLHKAARAGHTDIVHNLIHCAKNTPISSSKDAEIGRAEAIDFIRAENGEKETVMHEAVRGCHLQMVKLLIREDPQLLYMVNYAGESPLHLVVKKGALDIVEEILESNRCSFKGPNGWTVLHTAIVHKREDMAKLLLDKKLGLVKEADDNGRTPLHFASALGLSDFVQMLLKYDTSTTCFLDKNGSAPIHLAAHFGRLSIIKKFIRVQPDIKDLLDGASRNILHIATECQQVNVVKYILKKKCFAELLNGKDKHSNTPLHQATITGTPYIVNILVRDKRVDVTATNRERYTAMAIAMSQRDESKKQGKRYTQGQALVFAALIHAARPPWYEYNPSGCLDEDMTTNGESIESYRNKGNTLLVVATLVATVTFAAAFTLPGGYQSDGPNQGMATLRDLPNFKGFVNIVAWNMYISILAVVALIWLQLAKKVRAVRLLLLAAQFLTFLAVSYMRRAFSAGLTLTVLPEDTGLKRVIIWLDILICIISLGGVVLELVRILSSAVRLEKSWIFVLSWIHENFRDTEKDVSMLFCYTPV
ncbi:Ankyrin repeat-containing protein [Thalictrum thalictroides]|uniref:Ankyrin repeat-containing protein n=1 Tax=Thalictrum thalictroides TaxID=46969 RepID=A0A7J6X8N1_THATH|nr:Ankyrin repeat-containing protein [Thalictrum thalictroides]